MAPALTCVQVVEMVTDHLEGSLSPEEHAAVAAHLAHCFGCARYGEQIRLTVAVLAGLRPPGS
ncbi:MAG: zf-HC2 domain-containing protein [Actinomycetes bacterium]